MPPAFEKIVQTLFNLIPIKLELIQLAAQFCLFGDTVLLFLLVVKIVGNIVKNLLIILGITCLIMLALYAISNYDTALVNRIIAEAKTYLTNLLKQSPLSKAF